MGTPVASRPYGTRFLGNTNTTEVHDLTDERRGCQVEEILNARHAVIFSPDLLTQAHIEGFDNCNWCIGGSSR